MIEPTVMLGVAFLGLPLWMWMIAGTAGGWGAFDKWVSGPRKSALQKALKAMDIEQIEKGEKRKTKQHEMKREAGKQWLAQQAEKERGAIQAQQTRRTGEIVVGTPGVPPEQGGREGLTPLLADPMLARTLLDVEF